MKFATTDVLLSMAIAAMAMATNSLDDFNPVAVTVTVTEAVCMYGCAGEATLLSVAKALATAADASAATSLIADMMADRYHGGIAAAQPAMNTTTVTAVASATNCPASPTLNMGPALLPSVLDGHLSSTTANYTHTNGNETSRQRRSTGRESYCFTTSSWVGAGWYYIYLDSWGRDPDRCGKGVLDNLHGQCGGIQSWTCDFYGSGGVMLHFYTSGRARCALDAMWLASPKDHREVGLCCRYMGNPHVAWNTC